MIIKCKVCGEVKKYYSKGMCRTCYSKTYYNEYYIKNKDKFTKYRKLNKEKTKQYNKLWNITHPGYWKSRNDISKEMLKKSREKTRIERNLCTKIYHHYGIRMPIGWCREYIKKNGGNLNEIQSKVR